MTPLLPPKNIPTKCLIVEKPGAPFTLGDAILDEVREDEVLVEIKYSGLCHTVGRSPTPSVPSTPRTLNF